MTEKMNNKDNWSLPIATYEKALSTQTVLRLSQKAFAGEEMVDLRLWKLAKKGNYYPSRSGLCMRLSFWKEALKLFNDNGMGNIEGISNDART